MKATPAPHRLPPLFAGSRLVIYARLEEPSLGKVVLRAQGPDGPVELPLSLGPATPDDGSHLLATLWARAAIRDLEEGRSAWHNRQGSLQERTGRDRITAEIVRLGVTYGLVSRHTSFVAVEQRESPVPGDAVLRCVPVALTRGWGGQDSGTIGQPDLWQPAGSTMGPFLGDDSPDFARSEEGTAGVRFSGVPRPEASMPETSVREPRGSLLDRFLGRKPTPPASDDPLLRLVQLQRANGCWELGPELAEVLGVDLSRLESAIQGARGGDDARRAWATALALAWLLARPEDRTLWELIADKARAWLAATAAEPAGDLTFEEQAIAFLREAPRG
jgi:hypothetical protein